MPEYLNIDRGQDFDEIRGLPLIIEIIKPGSVRYFLINEPEKFYRDYFGATTDRLIISPDMAENMAEIHGKSTSREVFESGKAFPVCLTRKYGFSYKEFRFQEKPERD